MCNTASKISILTSAAPRSQAGPDRAGGVIAAYTQLGALAVNSNDNIHTFISTKSHCLIRFFTTTSTGLSFPPPPFSPLCMCAHKTYESIVNLRGAHSPDRRSKHPKLGKNVCAIDLVKCTSFIFVLAPRAWNCYQSLFKLKTAGYYYLFTSQSTFQCHISVLYQRCPMFPYDVLYERLKLAFD